MAASNCCTSDYDPDSLSIDEAVEIILRQVTPISDTEVVAISDAHGRILSDAVTSAINVPPSRNSAMDGYAFRTQDLAAEQDYTTLTLAGTSLAGHPWKNPVPNGSAIRIMTGAVIPQELDCVVPQENVTDLGDSVRIASEQESGQFIRLAGSDIARGTQVLPANTRLEAAEMGILAAIGCATVRVYRKPVVAIFSTGDELRDVDQALTPGTIHDSNRAVLTGLLARYEVTTRDLGIVQDRIDALEQVFRETEGADLVLSTGGVSVGEADYVRSIIEKQGELTFWKVAMKPGRPLTLGRLAGGQMFFGLPGNPVSGMVTFLLFVAEALQKLKHLPPREKLTLRASNLNTLKKLPGRVEYQRGVLSQTGNSEYQVTSTGHQDSHVLTSMHKANCFIVLDQDCGGVAAGEMVDVLPFSSL